MAESEQNKRGNRKERRGTVVSRSGDKSVVVVVEQRKRHPLYEKVIRQSKRYHVHDADNRAQVGDKVTIVECRPMSRTKRWRVKEIIESNAS